MANRRVLVLLTVLGAAVLYRVSRGGAFQRLACNLRTFVLPSAGLYDDMAKGSPFGGGIVEEVRWFGPVAAFSRLRLHRSASG